jgi:hypothetical protein
MIPIFGLLVQYKSDQLSFSHLLETILYIVLWECSPCKVGAPPLKIAHAVFGTNFKPRYE